VPADGAGQVCRCRQDREGEGGRVGTIAGRHAKKKIQII
jgi:hypothetical protein